MPTRGRGVRVAKCQRVARRSCEGYIVGTAFRRRNEVLARTGSLSIKPGGTGPVAQLAGCRDLHFALPLACSFESSREDEHVFTPSSMSICHGD